MSVCDTDNLGIAYTKNQAKFIFGRSCDSDKNGPDIASTCSSENVVSFMSDELSVHGETEGNANDSNNIGNTSIDEHNDYEDVFIYKHSQSNNVNEDIRFFRNNVFGGYTELSDDLKDKLQKVKNKSTFNYKIAAGSFLLITFFLTGILVEKVTCLISLPTFCSGMTLINISVANI